MMTVTEETLDRYVLLEDLLAIPGPFGFSIPRMQVIECLTIRGRDYEFYYNNRKKPFMIFIYDAFQKKIQARKISVNCGQELHADEDRFLAILSNIEERILKKNETISTPHAPEYEGFLAQTKELTVATQQLAEEIAVLENKEMIKDILSRIQSELAGVQELIEQQKVMKLKEVLSDVD